MKTVRDLGLDVIFSVDVIALNCAFFFITYMYFYSSIHLKIIFLRQKVSKHLNIVPEYFNRLKECGILKKRRRGCRGGKGRGVSPRYRLTGGINYGNLRAIPLNPTINSSNNIKIALMNTQSIRNKTAYINQLLIENKLDFCLITETWLTDDDIVLRTAATPPSYVFLDCCRHQGRGGGTALIAKQIYKPKISNYMHKQTYEFSEYNLTINKLHILVIVVYRPPYSQRNPNSVSSFIDEFQNHIENIISTTKYLVIAGDFNVHVDKPNDSQVKNFLDFLDCMGLVNNTSFPTHNLGHTLDLV